MRVLETVLRLSHPIMPFITEEFGTVLRTLRALSLIRVATVLCFNPTPVTDESLVDQVAIDDIEWVKRVIVGVSNVRGEMNISPATSLSIYFARGDASDKRRLQENQQYLCKLAKLDSITWLDNPDEAPLSATALAGDLEILVPMAGLIDVDAELKRLTKEIEKLSGEVSRNCLAKIEQ